jgi:hypothetical protein
MVGPTVRRANVRTIALSDAGPAESLRHNENLLGRLFDVRARIVVMFFATWPTTVKVSDHEQESRDRLWAPMPLVDRRRVRA